MKEPRNIQLFLLRGTPEEALEECRSCPYVNSSLCLKFMSEEDEEKEEEKTEVRSEYVDRHPEYEYIRLSLHTPIGVGVHDQIDFVFPFQLLQDGYHERWIDMKNVNYYFEKRKIILFVCHPTPDEEGDGGEEFFTPSPARTPTSGQIGILLKK